MNTKSRMENSIRNSIVGILSQACGVVISFATRIFFVKFLNEEYLGVNGLFSNILTVLSLAELGVGTSIIYSLYKPVAEKNEEQISALLNYFKRAYALIGIVITILGLLLLPFLDLIIKDTPDIPNLSLLYVLFLINTSCSYLGAYRRAIFSADQRESLLSAWRLIFTIIKAVGQCTVLIVSRNFILYLVIQILCTLSENIYVYIKSNQYYPFLKLNVKSRLSRKYINIIKTDIKSLMIYKIGSTALDGTDNIILSALVGVIWVGKLSNYTLIISAVSMLTTQIVNALTASVGNFIATEDESRYEDLLFKILFSSFVIYGFSCVCLCCLATDFVQLIFGKQYILEFPTVFVACLNYYIFGMMNSIWTFRTTMGLFKYGKYRPLVSACINIFVSIVLAKKMGLIGVLLGTTITRFITNIWYDPYIVYKHGIKRNPKIYYLKWTKYLFVSLMSILFCELIFNFFAEVSFGILILKTIICVMSFGIVMFLTSSKQSEYEYFKETIKKYLGLNKS